MPSDISLKLMNAGHRLLKRVSFGRLGNSISGMPVIELTTTGAKSGLPRTVQLTSPVQLDGNLVIVASRGGDDRHPAWYHNLLAHPDVTVVGADGISKSRTARVATDAEREALWPKVTEAYRGYAGYQRKTDRVIPLVILESA